MDQIAPTDSLLARPATAADASEVMRLVNEAVWNDVGMRLYRDGDLQREWDGRDPGDILAIEAPGSGVVAFVSFESDDDGFYFEGFVDPAHEGRGIGTHIIELAELRAQAETERKAFIEAGQALRVQPTRPELEPSTNVSA